MSTRNHRIRSTNFIHSLGWSYASHSLLPDMLFVLGDSSSFISADNAIAKCKRGCPSQSSLIVNTIYSSLYVSTYICLVSESFTLLFVFPRRLPCPTVCTADWLAALPCQTSQEHWHITSSKFTHVYIQASMFTLID